MTVHLYNINMRLTLSVYHKSIARYKLLLYNNRCKYQIKTNLGFLHQNPLKKGKNYEELWIFVVDETRNAFRVVLCHTCSYLTDWLKKYRSELFKICPFLWTPLRHKNCPGRKGGGGQLKQHFITSHVHLHSNIINDNINDNIQVLEKVFFLHVCKYSEVNISFPIVAISYPQV